MGSHYGHPKRKSFDKNAMSDLIFASANVMELADYNTPEMAPNVKTTKTWRPNDIHQSVWQLKSLQDPDPIVAEPFNGASPVEYNLHLKTIGATVCFVYRSNTEWMGTLCPDNGTNLLISKELQELRIGELLNGLADFPKDIAAAEYPILDAWRVPNHEMAGVTFNSNVFETIITSNYGRVPGKNNTSLRVRKGIISSLRNRYGIDR